MGGALPPSSSTMHVPAAGSAASMLQTAESIVKHASTGTHGVQVVSEALLGHPIAQDAAAESTRNFSISSQMARSSSFAMSRSLSAASASSDSPHQPRHGAASPAELDYAARMRDHVGGVLQARAQAMSKAESAQGHDSFVEGMPTHALQDCSVPPLVLGVDQMHVRTIAACTAAQEGKEQLRMQALIRAGAETIPPAPSKADTLAGEDYASHMLPAGIGTPSASHKPFTAHSEMPQSPLPLTPQTISFDAYLAHLGLEHIPLPSDGFEQQWGVRGQPRQGGKSVQESHRNGLLWKQKRWDHPEAGLGFSLSGVPSLPLMPRPPLQMLPPPSSPSLLRSTNPGGRSASSHAYPFPLDSPVFQSRNMNWHTGSSSSSSSSGSGFFTPTGMPSTGGSSRTSAGQPSKSRNPSRRREGLDETGEGRYPFQVVQTPGGTARAGWWVPSNAVSARRRASATTVSAGFDAAGGEHQRGERAAAGDASWDSTETGSSTGSAGSTNQMLFQPSYHIFTMEEYAALASAAAYATAALTSTQASRGTASEPVAAEPSSRWRALSPTQQSAIASQLRAWAGLEGPQAQQEARRSLQERQEHIRSAVKSGQHRVGRAGLETDENLPSPTSFFPPDFASHYRAQLHALAEGYYQRLHSDGFQGPGRSAEAEQETPPPAMDVDIDIDSGSAQVPMSGIEATVGLKAENHTLQAPNAEKLARTPPAAPLGGAKRRDRSRSPVMAGRKPASAGWHEPDGKKGLSAEALDMLSSAASSSSLTDVRPSTPAAPSGPESAGGAADPMELISAASNAAGLDVHSAELRDQLLQYAHGLYSSGPGDDEERREQEQQMGLTDPPSTPNVRLQRLHPTLLPLLHTLLKLHPRHLPTLLLLSCAYYTSGNLTSSLWYNNRILEIDPNYVEAMSNIGTTLRALGRWREAEDWWWKAIRLRPSYWDATENLLGVLCYPRQAPSKGSEPSPGGPPDGTSGPRFQEALTLCEFVEEGLSLTAREVPGVSSAPDTHARPSPVCMPARLSVLQTPRLQNLFYAKGNLKYVLPQHGQVASAREYEKAVEVALSPAGSAGYTVRDVAVATCVIGLLSMGAVVPGSAASNAAIEVAVAIGLDPRDARHESIAVSGRFSELVPGGILRLVKRAGDGLVEVLLRLGGGQLPMILLLPESAVQITKYLFADTEGVLPTMVPDAKSTGGASRSSQHQEALVQAMHTTSTVLLTLAKLFQDATSRPAPGPHGPLRLGGIPASTSLVLTLYYVSLSLQPSASTCNNAGILLSSVPVVTTLLNSTGQKQQLNGQALAMQYYMYGLQLDARHTHLYTNLGSLLKDLGHLSEAILMYEKAVDCNPNFDVALANLGNAIKDQGRTQDSVVYYRRAVQINPNFPEALCGLVNALLAVCDWREVYALDPAWPGWMKDVLRLVETQLDEGAQYGAGSLMASGSIDTWVERITAALHDPRTATREAWVRRLEAFYGPLDRAAHKINEGSFVIRLVERLMRRTQRQWYLDHYGAHVSWSEPRPHIEPAEADVRRYPTIPLPPSLITPAIPTVLPFHTFTAKGLTPRQIRLISHRNALRISQTTLTQTWRPPHVYPPPPPPAPHLRIGYVSSDLNNHPLAHLMQSVFGMHDGRSFEVFCYATTASDGSPYRLKIEREAQHFTDVSGWSHAQLISRILADGIHILMNLNGYTKGARNEVFAARPCPVQMEFMGFAGGLASEWTDWIVADPIVCPPEMTAVDRWRAMRKREEEVEGPRSLPFERRPTHFGGDLDPEDPSEEWAYNDRFIYMPHSYFVNDHAQGFREPDVRPRMGGEGASDVVKPHEMSDEEAWAEEEERRWRYRRDLFPNVPDDFVIFADFNQLYKCDPDLLRLWLRILERVPRSILWLLRFPAAGEAHLVRSAREWGGDEVASRLVFTDVAPKHVHIHRGRIADVFLDTLECNAHTTAADILWSATPVVTWPRHGHKMCSNVAASIVQATGYGEQMIVRSEEEYEERAVQLARSLRYEYVDAEGRSVEADGTEEVMGADKLRADPSAVTAKPHGQATGGGGGGGDSTTKATSAASKIDAAMALDAAPAPTNVDNGGKAGAAAASAGRKDASEDHQNRDGDAVWGPPPLRSTIQVAILSRAPSNVVSRRSSGELASLRRSLFLGREKSALFDTRGWVRALERGYGEAWRRWVKGTDGEEWDEWKALGEDEEEVRSGHIWVRPD